MQKYWRRGEPFVWLTGAALTLTLVMAAALIIVVMVNGLGVFWPTEVTQAKFQDGTRVMGEIIKREPLPSGEGDRIQFKTGNRDLYGLDFRWVDTAGIIELDHPVEAVVLEREEYGNFYGFLHEINAPDLDQPAGETLGEQLSAVRQSVEKRQQEIGQLEERVAGLSDRMQDLRLELQKLEFEGYPPESSAVKEVRQRQSLLREDFDTLVARHEDRRRELRQIQATFADVSGTLKTVAVADIVRAYYPNDMAWWEKAVFYLSKLKELFLGEPREANTEGGLFPAIFGTVMLIFLMSLFSFPLGVIAAIYLREYAKEGPIVRVVRIAVNNLAGIPSIVYGIFGLGFFIYGVGGSLDRLFFPERLPTPTFGTGGILWASLTLALLTVPVVIVATDEALGAIPKGVREGSLALGATKFQTLSRILVPMASPGIMTGLILAMARAAGEVAPLMITGVVKLAPALPLDGDFPFLHLDRKFMHLGFHIYDIGFQSPNVEAAKPMVFVTTLLLVLIVLIMSSVAIHLRNKMKKRYTYGTF